MIKNGNQKGRGALILTLPKHKDTAKSLYNDFCEMTQREQDEEMEDVTTADDETTVNSNVKSNAAQIKAMFQQDDFPDLEGHGADRAASTQ
jgi:hypothetical protein